MVEKIVSKTTSQTKEIAVKLAKDILNKKTGKVAVVLALKGNLGAGKTTFVQGFAKGLGVRGKILSPTFNIMKRFKINNSIFENFYHIDCYRLESKKDLEQLGFREIVLNPKNIIAIEWPEKIKGGGIKFSVEIKFKHSKEDTRILDIKK